MAVELAKNVYWVGVVDWALDHFHGHELSTHRGSTYNSYLIKDEKTVLIDTVWDPFTDEFVERLKELVDPADIDIVVANHSEVDHSGALPEIMRLAPNATVIVSPKGMDSFPGHYHKDWNFKVVKTGDSVNIGSRNLVFIEAPMLHWPDSMFTYLKEDGILFPNDAFGQHFATTYRFNDQVDQKELYEEALKYYANILTPYSPMVSKKIDEVVAMGVPVNMIAPSHGVIWRENPMQIVERYKEWAAQKPSKKAVILYDTMWNATRKMADAISEGLGEGGVPSRVFHMPTSDRNDVITEIFKSGAVVVGSSTINNSVLPTIAPILEDLKGLKFRNKVTGAFGSYGWSGESVPKIKKHLESCGFDVVGDGVAAKWQPTVEDLDGCREYGRKIAEELVRKLA